MSQPLVSVIVPIYKVEPYLRRCLDSIVNQTYTNLEIILVDDGSPDACPQICDEYAARDNRIVVIHKENGGLSDARNAGLDICKGEYISFIDSDDWVDEKYVEVLYEIQKKTAAELSICVYDSFLEDGRLSSSCLSKTSGIISWDFHEVLIRLCAEDTLGLMAVWGKLYARMLFDSIRFPKGKLYEDAYINYKLYMQCDKVCYSEIPLYHYRIRNGSIMSNAKGSIYDLEPKIKRYEFLMENCEEAANYCIEKLCWNVLFATSKSDEYLIENTPFKNRKDAVKYFRLLVLHFLKCKQISYIQKILMFIFYLFPYSYYLYRKISPFHLRKN